MQTSRLAWYTFPTMNPFIRALLLNPWTFIILVALVGVYLVWKSKREEFVSIGGKSMLATFTRNLTEDVRAGKIDIVVGREAEVDRVIHILSRRTKNNPILLGEPGVGKTAIVEGLAHRIVSSDVPDNLKGKEVLALDLPGLISGTKYRGEFEDRLKKILKEILDGKRTFIIFIDEVHMIVQAKGSEGALNVSDILKPAMARGELQTVGATTLKEYQAYIRTDDALDRRFQPVIVNEPNAADALHIVRGIKSIYEKHHGVTFSDEALQAAVNFSSKYITGRYLPDKAIDLIDEAGASVGIESAHGARHAGAIMAAAAESKQSISETSKQHRKLLVEELPRLKKLMEEMKEENEVAEIEKKMEHTIAQLGELEKEQSKEKPVVTADDIRKIVAEWTGKPLTEVV